MRYTALCLLAGHVWLGVSGILFLVHPGISGGPPYDAALHAAFLGFVISMVFGHALIILPSVAGIFLRYHPGFYLPLALLHASVFLRAAADLTGASVCRNRSGALTAAAFGLFCLAVAGAALSARFAPSAETAA